MQKQSLQYYQYDIMAQDGRNEDTTPSVVTILSKTRLSIIIIGYVYLVLYMGAY